MTKDKRSARQGQGSMMTKDKRFDKTIGKLCIHSTWRSIQKQRQTFMKIFFENWTLTPKRSNFKKIIAELIRTHVALT